MSDVLPEILYHYTNSVGLLGIIESKSLWATDTRFLNDSSEIRYPRDILVALVDEVKLEYDATHPVAAEILALVTELADVPDAPPTFAACMCAEGDLLSQWRGYGDAGGGYAVGMNRERLRDIAFDQNVELMPVLYDLDAQKDLLSTAVKDAVEYAEQDRVQTLVASTDRDVVLGIALTEAMLEVKNRHFREEKEWRLARTAWKRHASNPTTRFRTWKESVIPYQEISLSASESSSDAFEVIVVGPTSDPSITATGIRDLLDQNDLEHVRVEKSEIPLRG